MIVGERLRGWKVKVGSTTIMKHSVSMYLWIKNSRLNHFDKSDFVRVWSAPELVFLMGTGTRSGGVALKGYRAKRM